MKCELNSSLSYLSFGKKTKNTPENSGQLNLGVLEPPDSLPGASIYKTVYAKSASKPEKLKGNRRATAGTTSAMCAFSAMLLSVGSVFLSFLKSKK